MKRFFLLFALGAVATTAWASSAQAEFPRRQARVANYFSSARPWHGEYAYTQWGEPVALVVPPHADTMAAWSWGVSQSEVRPLYHQFGRADPGPAAIQPGSPFFPTPLWPSHTDQFGVYPVRGPWR